MDAEPPKADLPKGKRRWFQFSLRTLLIVVTLLAISSAGWSRLFRPHEDQSLSADAAMLDLAWFVIAMTALSAAWGLPFRCAWTSAGIGFLFAVIVGLLWIGKLMQGLSG
jgi:uncharacterized membrane protein